MRDHFWRSAVVALAIAFGPAGAASAASCDDTNLTVTKQTRARAERAARCLVNEIRGDHGLRPLQGSAQLRKAANAHARDMVRRRFFSHVSPDGTTLIDRVSATGYLDGHDRWMIGENLAWGSGRLSTPASIVDAWMRSAPHRENILRARFRQAALVVVVGAPKRAAGDKGTYVHVFGWRR